MNARKKRLIATVVAVVLTLAMVVPVILSYLMA